jgi:hypothetical protein
VVPGHKPSANSPDVVPDDPLPHGSMDSTSASNSGASSSFAITTSPTAIGRLASRIARRHADRAAVVAGVVNAPSGQMRFVMYLILRPGAAYHNPGASRFFHPSLYGLYVRHEPSFSRAMAAWYSAISRFIRSMRR